MNSIPTSSIYKINKVLGHSFVTKYGTTRGVIVLGRVIPFGVGLVIGASANAVFCQGVIKASDRAFGPAPDSDPAGEEPARKVC